MVLRVDAEGWRYWDSVRDICRLQETEKDWRGICMDGKGWYWWKIELKIVGGFRQMLILVTIITGRSANRFRVWDIRVCLGANESGYPCRVVGSCPVMPVFFQPSLSSKPFWQPIIPSICDSKLGCCPSVMSVFQSVWLWSNQDCPRSFRTFF